MYSGKPEKILLDSYRGIVTKNRPYLTMNNESLTRLIIKLELRRLDSVNPIDEYILKSKQDNIINEMALRN